MLEETKKSVFFDKKGLTFYLYIEVNSKQFNLSFLILFDFIQKVERSSKYFETTFSISPSEKFHIENMSLLRETLSSYFAGFSIEGVEINGFNSIKGPEIVLIYHFFKGDDFDMNSYKDYNVTKDWFKVFKEIRNVVYTGIEETIKKSPHANKTVDFTAIVRRDDPDQIEILLVQIAFFSVTSAKKSEAIQVIKKLSKEQQDCFKNEILRPKSTVSPSNSSSNVNTPTTSPTSSPTKVSSSPTHENSEEVINQLKKRVEELTKSNTALKSENENLRSEINSLDNEQDEPNQKMEEVDEEHILHKIAGVKAELFVFQQENKTKQTKKQQLLDIQKHVASLQETINHLKEEEAKLQSQLTNEESKGPNYEVLHNKLQELRLDPKMKEVTDLIDTIKQNKSKLRALHRQKERLQAKLDGQQGIAVLEDRKRFLEDLLQNNIKRKQRAELHLALSQKKMRIDAFQQEMRSFI